MKRRLLLVFAVAATFHPLWCHSEEAVPVKTKLVSVSLFKNGIGSVTREGAIQRGDSVVILEALPPAIHGTFWVFPLDAGVSIKDLVAFERETKEVRPASNLFELLEANTGKTVEVRTTDKEVIRGKILAAPYSAPAALPRSMEAMTSPPPESPSVLYLETDHGMVALTRTEVRQVSIADGKLNTAFEQKKQATFIQMHAANNGGNGRFAIQYLTRGLSWAPSCSIDITDPKKAIVMAKGEILNETEDFDQVSVNLITGFPNLQFTGATDPLTARMDVASFLRSLTSRPQFDPLANQSPIVAQQSIYTGRNFPEMEGAYPVAPVEGQTHEDLFFYEQKGVRLKKGERGYYQLFELEVPYEHVYEWKIADLLDEEERYRYSGGRPEPQPQEEVWHSLRLINTGGIPWTTAPALTKQNGQILGQDLIYYTSPGNKTMVRITRAVDVKAEQTEYETQRQRNAVRLYGSDYDLVTLKGALHIVNYANKNVVLTITKNLSGELIRSTPVAKVEQSAKGLRKANPRNVLQWELPVNARGNLDIEYEYRVYVRN